MKKIIAALALVLSLSACGEGMEDPAESDTPPTAKPGYGVVETDSGRAYMVEINGTKCVILDHHRGGGIDCNWEATE